MRLTDLVKQRGFVKIAEFTPPKDYSIGELIRKIDSINGSIDAVSITSSPNGSYCADALATASEIKRKTGKEVISHMTLRDHTRRGIYGSLMGAAIHDIENILVIRGDRYVCENGNYKYASELINDIYALNNGTHAQSTSNKTEFCVGAAGHPYMNREKEIENIKRKVNSGAEYIITQIIFDADEYFNYVNDLKNAGVNAIVMPGILPIKSRKTIDFVEDKIREVHIPESVKERIRNAGNEESIKKEGIEIARELIYKLRTGGAPGVNIFSMGDAGLAYSVVNGH